MKLLFVLPEFGPNGRGGIATFYHHLIPGLVRAGCKVDICVSGPDLGEAVSDKKSCRIFVTDSALIKRNADQLSHLAPVPAVRSALATAFAAWERCDRGAGYDIVEVTDWGMLYAPWLASTSRPRVVVQLHGSNGQVDFYDPLEGAELAGLTTRLVEAALFGRADELQTTGPRNAESWTNLLDRPVHHIWPAWSVELGRAQNPSARQSDQYGIAVGRIQSWKGPDVLCKAAALLGSSAPEIRWVGRDHPYRRLGQSFSEYLKKTYPTVWGKSINPIGEFSRESTSALQAAAKFVVVPSIWDTCNLTAIEAMGAGKVVICSEGAGAATLIDHGTNGFRFPAGDAVRLAEQIAKIEALSASERESIGLRASETVKRELDADRIVSIRLERFARLMAAPPARKGPHPWLESFFASSVKPRPFGFLDSLPLREIVRHAARRSMSRIRSGTR